MSNRTLIVGAIVITVGLIAFGRWFNGSNSVPAQGIAINGNGQAANVGNALNDRGNAPDFSLDKLGGGKITLAEYRGEKPVILDFWASWCPNCRRDMPRLSRFYEEYKDQVEVIGVNLQESPSTVEKYIASAGISFPIVFDPRGLASRSYGVQYTNTHVLIDKEGKVVRVIPGDIRESDIKGLINL